MNQILAVLLIVAFAGLTSCAAPQSSTGGDYELRSATPGIVDHNVIPKKSK